MQWDYANSCIIDWYRQKVLHSTHIFSHFISNDLFCIEHQQTLPFVLPFVSEKLQQNYSFSKAEWLKNDAPYLFDKLKHAETWLSDPFFIQTIKTNLVKLISIHPDLRFTIKNYINVMHSENEDYTKLLLDSYKEFPYPIATHFFFECTRHVNIKLCYF